jgi:hypothetical protein
MSVVCGKLVGGGQQFDGYHLVNSGQLVGVQLTDSGH